MLIAVALLWLSWPSLHRPDAALAAGGQRWWPDWQGRLTWMLGITFGASGSVYFTSNTFLPGYLHSLGRADLVSMTLGSINAAQVVAILVLPAMAARVQHRMWPYLLFAPLTLAGLVGVLAPSAPVIVASAALVGFSQAILFSMLLSLPALLVRSADLPRTAAGMFTIGYALTVIIPIVSGALWDVTGAAWTAFVPIHVCAVVLLILGAVLSRHPAT
jgi:CP family cyanate transporter-like MFS transporter